MIRDFMAMAMVGMHHIDNVLMGMPVLFDLGMMLGNDPRQFCEVMSDRTGVCGQKHTNRQCDGQHSLQVSRYSPHHFARICGSWPIQISGLFTANAKTRQ
jgi:hypothetical protein